MTEPSTSSGPIRSRLWSLFMLLDLWRCAGGRRGLDAATGRAETGNEGPEGDFSGIDCLVPCSGKLVLRDGERKELQRTLLRPVVPPRRHGDGRNEGEVLLHSQFLSALWSRHPFPSYNRTCRISPSASFPEVRKKAAIRLRRAGQGQKLRASAPR